MFWEAVNKGLEILEFWQFWACIVIFALLFITSFYFMGMISENSLGNSKIGYVRMGFLGGAFLLIFCTVILSSLLVSLLMPLMTVGNELMPLTYFFEDWLVILGAGFAGIVLLFLLAFIPLIGQIITDTPGISIFIIGTFIFHDLSDFDLIKFQKIFEVKDNIKLDFWSFLGFLMIAYLFYWLLTIAASTILVSLKTQEDRGKVVMLLLAGPVLGTISGVLTLSVYISYVLLKLT